MQSKALVTPVSLALLRFRCTNFSSIPYSAFRTPLTVSSDLLKVKNRLGKFRWRSTVVTLRAPKHFKVGRQHYNKSRRTSYVYAEPIKLHWVYLKTHEPFIGQFTNFCNGVDFLQFQSPLTTTKTVSITVRTRVTFRSLA